MVSTITLAALAQLAALRQRGDGYRKVNFPEKLNFTAATARFRKPPIAPRSGIYYFHCRFLTKTRVKRNGAQNRQIGHPPPSKPTFSTKIHLHTSVTVSGWLGRVRCQVPASMSDRSESTSESRRCLAVWPAWLLMFGDVERFGFDYNTCGTCATGSAKAKRGWISKS